MTKEKGVSTLLVPNGITSVDGIIISIIIKSVKEKQHHESEDGVLFTLQR
jgi:hypothetical protein